MGLFRRRAEDHARFVLDRTWSDPALDAGVEAVAEGHLAAGKALLAETRGDSDRRTLRLDALARAANGQSERLADLLRDADEDPDLWVWHGCVIADEAWSAFDGHLSDEEFQRFFALLQEAHDSLLRAARLAPGDAAPWAVLQRVAALTQARREDVDRLWQEAVARSPRLFAAHWDRLGIVGDRWSGSEEEMFAFARDTVERAPAGSPIVAMLPLAHFIRYRRERDRLYEDNKFVAGAKLELRYFSHEVLGEIREADAKWESRQTPHPYALRAHNLFAGAYLQGNKMRDYDRRKRHLARIGRRVDSMPWAILSDDPVRTMAGGLRNLGLPLPEA